MDDIKDILRVKITDITPDFLADWDITSTIGEAILERAPVLTQVLRSAAQTERASRENTTKDCTTYNVSSSHDAACPSSIQLQSLFCCSLYRSRVQTGRTCDTLQCSGVHTRPLDLFSMLTFAQQSSSYEAYTTKLESMLSGFCCKEVLHSKTTNIACHQC
ncbi:hypothetical protein EV363DRAFT_1236503 [Boletus edulis]|nr:hypothetical protein EV363DRAFT_1236503 [Boletus edulis]